MFPIGYYSIFSFGSLLAHFWVPGQIVIKEVLKDCDLGKADCLASAGSSPGVLPSLRWKPTLTPGTES